MLMKKETGKAPWGYTVTYNRWGEMEFIPLISVKLRMIRKKLGMNQRDFAKRIGWNINKYSLMEQGKIEKLGCRYPEEAYPIRFILRVAETTGANPYWLTNDEEESIYDVDSDRAARKASEAVYQGLGGYMMFVEPLAIKEFKRYRLWWPEDELS